MKISSEIRSAAALVGEERAIELMATAGFDAWDFSMFDMCRCDWERRTAFPSPHPLSGPGYLAFARRLKRIGLDNGIVCNQSHAPFPSRFKGIGPWLLRAIECTAEAGGEICVVHPDNDASPEENAELYGSLLPFARSCGVRLAAENMWNWDGAQDRACFAACATEASFLAHLDAVGDPFLVACLDVGHAEMMGPGVSAQGLVRSLGPRLRALHLHDNDRRHDSHQIPFSLSIDFLPIVRALKEIGYAGYFTLEADRFLSAYTAETAFAGISRLAEAARRLALLYEQT